MRLCTYNQPEVCAFLCFENGSSIPIWVTRLWLHYQEICWSYFLFLQKLFQGSSWTEGRKSKSTVTSRTGKLSERFSIFWRRFSRAPVGLRVDTAWGHWWGCGRAGDGHAMFGLAEENNRREEGAKHRNTNFPLSAFDQAVSGGNNVSWMKPCFPTMEMQNSKAGEFFQ